MIDSAFFCTKPAYPLYICPYKNGIMQDLINNPNIQAIIVSIACGSLVGLEREYRNKSAGLRTVILICLGATVFTLISKLGQNSEDRIAANIVTGIGFIGAGVIFKGKFSVKGLTTAAVIWAMAGVGMMVGFGEYKLGLILSILMITVLSVFQQLETLMSEIYFSRIIYITFKDNTVESLRHFEAFMELNYVKPKRKGLEFEDNKLSVVYEISGKRKKIKAMNEKIIGLNYIYSFSNLSQ